MQSEKKKRVRSPPSLCTPPSFILTRLAVNNALHKNQEGGILNSIPGAIQCHLLLGRNEMVSVWSAASLGRKRVQGWVRMFGGWDAVPWMGQRGRAARAPLRRGDGKLPGGRLSPSERENREDANAPLIRLFGVSQARRGEEKMGGALFGQVSVNASQRIRRTQETYRLGAPTGWRLFALTALYP